MKTRNTVAAVALCVVAASTAAGDFIEGTGVLASYSTETTTVAETEFPSSFQTATIAWKNTSSVRVVTFGIAFTTDMHVPDAHLYKIDSGLHDSGFATNPGPINAVDIVLLENLHPRLMDMTIGLPGEGQPVSGLSKGPSFSMAFRGLLDEFNYVPIGTNAQGGDSNSPSGMSMSSAGFTSELPETLEEVTGTLDTLNSPLGKNGHYGDTALWGGAKFSAGGTGKGDGDDKLMVVPLPVPAILAGIGLASAVVMRRTIRRRGI